VPLTSGMPGPRALGKGVGGIAGNSEPENTCFPCRIPRGKHPPSGSGAPAPRQVGGRSGRWRAHLLGQPVRPRHQRAQHTGSRAPPSSASRTASRPRSADRETPMSRRAPPTGPPASRAPSRNRPPKGSPACCTSSDRLTCRPAPSRSYRPSPTSARAPSAAWIGRAKSVAPRRTASLCGSTRSRRSLTAWATRSRNRIAPRSSACSASAICRSPRRWNAMARSTAPRGNRALASSSGRPRHLPRPETSVRTSRRTAHASARRRE
jgi:hypothetical protein